MLSFVVIVLQVSTQRKLDKRSHTYETLQLMQVRSIAIYGIKKK